MQQLFPQQSKLFGFDRKVRRQRPETAQFFRLQQSWTLAVHITTASGDGTQDSVALQVLISARHGIRIDARLSRQFAYRRQGIVAFESASGDGVLQLGLDLEIDRRTQSGLHADNHLY